MKKQILFIAAFVLGLNVSFSQTKAEKKEAKKVQEELVYTEMKALVESKQFIFEATWLTTQGGKRINLIGNPNFVTIDSLQAKADLPYFGVVQSPSYGGDGGIEFDATYKDFEISYNDKKLMTTVKFNVSNKTENFDASLRVYGPESAYLVIYSSNRNSITYDGSIKPLETAKSED